MLSYDTSRDLNCDSAVLTSLPKKKKITIQTAVSLFTCSPYLWYIFYGGNVKSQQRYLFRWYFQSKMMKPKRALHCCVTSSFPFSLNSIFRIIINGCTRVSFKVIFISTRYKKLFLKFTMALIKQEEKITPRYSRKR